MRFRRRISRRRGRRSRFRNSLKLGFKRSKRHYTKLKRGGVRLP